MYILDTNTLISFFKGTGSVAKKLLSVSPQQIAIPSVVMHELEYSITKLPSPNKRRKQLKEFSNTVTILPFNEEEARAAANIRSSLDRKEKNISHYDILIAGTALHHNGTLVTHNTKKFKVVPRLKVENWL